MKLKKEFAEINTQNKNELHAKLNQWSEKHGFSMKKTGGDIFVANANQSRCWFKCSKTKACKYTQEWRLQFKDATHKEAKYIFINPFIIIQDDEYFDDFSFIDEKVKIQRGKRTLDDFNNVSNSKDSTAGEKKN